MFKSLKIIDEYKFTISVDCSLFLPGIENSNEVQINLKTLIKIIISYNNNNDDNNNFLNFEFLIFCCTIKKNIHIQFIEVHYINLGLTRQFRKIDKF